MSKQDSSRRPTVLHLNSLYYPHSVGGAERSVQALAEAQAERGMAVIVLSLQPDPGQEVRLVNGVKVYYVGLRNLYWPFANVPLPRFKKLLWHTVDSFNPLMSAAFNSILTTEAPDLVHTHNLTGFSASVWQAAIRRDVPVVHTLRDYSLLCPRATMFLNGKNCEAVHTSCSAFSAIRKTLSRGINAVTAVSRFTLERHTTAGAFTDIPIREVIYNIVPSRNGFAPRPNRAGEPFRCGFIGQLAPVKGIEVLLSAFSKLDNSRFELLIAGKGEPAYERSLKAQAAGRNIRFIGVVRPEEFYPSIDALIVPSIWHEPLGRVVLEAFSSGVPVVASSRGGTPEIVDNLHTGILFDPHNPEELRSALQKLAADNELRIQLATNASRKLAEFSAESICNKYKTVYERISVAR